MARLALLTGVVEAGALEDDRPEGGGHDARAIHRGANEGVLRRCRREQSDPPDAHLAAARRGRDARLRREHREGAPLDRRADTVSTITDGSLLPARRRAGGGAV